MEIPFGISCIATSLKLAGHSVKLMLVTPTTSIYDELKSMIDGLQPGLFCLTAVSTQIPVIKQVGEAIKKIDPSIYIIMGGAHTTLNPDEVIDYNFVDALCIGEGEKAVVKLAGQLEEKATPTRIPNLWIKNRMAGQIERNSIQRFIEDLDSLPFLDRSMWDPLISDRDIARHAVLVGRGCPNRCTYCSNHALARVAKGRYVRFRSTNNIIAELSSLVERYSEMKEVFLEVETVGVNLKYTYQLLSDLASFNKTLQDPLRFGTNIAVTGKIKNNQELLEAFRKANFKYLIIGLESGSERIRNEVLNRPRYSNKDIIEFCRLAREYSIKIKINVLIGLPGETRNDFQETIKCVRSCQPAGGVAPAIFFPYPGTKLYELCREQKLLRPVAKTTIIERTSSVLDLPGFPPWQIKKEQILFYYKVFKGYKPWSDLISHTARNILGMFPRVKRTLSYLRK